MGMSKQHQRRRRKNQNKTPVSRTRIITVSLTTVRNPLHNHPLMRKSSVHQKTNKSKRQHDKVTLRRQAYSDYSERSNGYQQTSKFAGFFMSFLYVFS